MREPGRVWVRRGLLGLAVWLVICGLGFWQGMAPNPVLIALAVIGGGTVLVLLVNVSARTEPPDWRVFSDEPVRPPGEDQRLAMLARMVHAHQVSNEVDTQLRDHLLRIADDRLLASHGIRRGADPERAAELLGPDLVRFADAPAPYPRLRPAQIEVLIDRIEDL